MFVNRKKLEARCERGILLLTLMILVGAPLAFGAVPTWAFLTVQSFAAGVLVLWSIKLWANPKTKILWPPLAWAVLAFMLYALARYFTADIEYVARQEVMQVWLYGFLFLAMLNNLHGQEETRLVSFTLIVLAAIIASYAVGQELRHSKYIWNVVSPYPGRASGTFISPNNLSCYIAMLLPLALAYLIAGRIEVVPRILLGYVALTLVAGLAVTFSRGGYLGAAAGFFMLLGILCGHRNHRWKAIVLLLLVVGGIGLFGTLYLTKSVGYMQRMKKPDATSNTSGMYEMSSRLIMWGAAVRMWEDHVWWGVGPAHYDYRFREYRPESLQLRPDRAHNDYLNLLADWGVAGGVIVMTGLGIFVFTLARTWPHVRREVKDFGHGQSNRYAFFVGAVGGLTALVVHSFTDFNLHIPANALVGVTLLALVASNVRFATEQYWFRAGLPLKLGLTTVLIAMIGCIGWQDWRLGREAIWVAKAGRMQNFSTARATALQTAFACEPKNAETAYNIGECYRTQSLEGGTNYVELAQQALNWYAIGSQLNVHDGYNYLRSGMCLDWLGRHAEAEKLFYQAEALDPNGYYMVANIGWHFVQIGDYAAAREWFTRSLQLSGDNVIARSYLQICESKLADEASGRLILPLNF